jgi:hypothetical protein
MWLAEDLGTTSGFQRKQAGAVATAPALGWNNC